MNNKNIVTGVLGLTSALLISGCATQTGYIESGGTESIVSLNKIDIQDWQNAADQMVQSLLTSGRLENAPRQPAVLAISRITNNTQQMVDTDALVKKIRVQLNKSGKVVTTTTIGLGGAAEDPLAKSQAEYNAFMNDEKPAVAQPDFSLSGKLTESRTNAGRKKQVTYAFHLSLTQISTGLAIWEDEVEITKQGKKNSVGW
ncbi:penicillin-binding protein activator LpoB [Verrucomicrobia bacterium S94]|nr:penicillin-binding protein activator LpoB [Verrucomicrobia bacterium S94]